MEACNKSRGKKSSTKSIKEIYISMGLYEGIKDVAKIVQQADNLDLYRSLLDLSAQALDMQAEIANLTKENEELKRELFKEKML